MQHRAKKKTNKQGGRKVWNKKRTRVREKWNDVKRDDRLRDEESVSRKWKEVKN
jgi:hypothetical protein